MRGRALRIAVLALLVVFGGCLEPAYAVTIWKDSQIRVTALPGEPTLEQAITGGDLGAGGGSIDVAEQGGGTSVSPTTTITLNETTGLSLAPGGAGEAILSLSAIPDSAISDSLTIGPGGSVDDAALSAPPTADDLSDNTPADLPYTPTTAADWTSWTTAPTNVLEALEKVASWLDDFMSIDTNEVVGLTQGTLGDLLRAFLGGPRQACRTEFIKGGGYDSGSLTFDWTCGNYARTGNVYTCTCDGVRSGTCPGSATVGLQACLYDGEEPRVNAWQDIIAAADETREGGTIYLPEGLYVGSGCGEDQDGNDQSCYRTRNMYPTGNPLKILNLGWGQKIVGAGRDHGGPFDGARTGTWLLNDHGLPTDLDRNGDEQVMNGRLIGAGSVIGSNSQCKGDGNNSSPDDWDATFEKAVCQYDQCGGGECWGTNNSIGLPISDWGVSAEVLSVDRVNGTICLENAVADVGLCALDRRVRCASANHCDDVPGNDLGPCIPFSDHLEDVIEDAGQVKYLISKQTNEDADGADASTSASGFVVRPTDVGATCSTTGRTITVQEVDGFPGIFSALETGAGPAFQAVAPWVERATFSDLSTMPVHMNGEDYTSDGGPNCTGAGGSGCDLTSPLSCGTGTFGGFDHIASWYCSATAHSCFDGQASNFGSACHVRDSLFMEERPETHQGHDFTGEILFERNLVKGFTDEFKNASLPVALFNCFADDCEIIGNTIKNNRADRGWYLNKPQRNTRILRNQIEDNYFPGGVFFYEGAHAVRVEGNTLSSNVGPYVSIAAHETKDVTKLRHLNNIIIGNGNVGTYGNSEQSGAAKAFVLVDDLNDSADYDEGLVQDVRFDGDHWETDQDDALGVWFGDSLDASDTHALARSEFSFEGITVRAGSGFQFLSVGDLTAGNCGTLPCDAADAADIYLGARTPYVSTIRVNGQPAADDSGSRVDWFYADDDTITDGDCMQIDAKTIDGNTWQPGTVDTNLRFGRAHWVRRITATLKAAFDSSESADLVVEVGNLSSSTETWNSKTDASTWIDLGGTAMNGVGEVASVVLDKEISSGHWVRVCLEDDSADDDCVDGTACTLPATNVRIHAEIDSVPF